MGFMLNIKGIKINWTCQPVNILTRIDLEPHERVFFFFFPYGGKWRRVERGLNDKKISNFPRLVCIFVLLIS